MMVVAVVVGLPVGKWLNAASGTKGFFPGQDQSRRQGRGPHPLLQNLRE